MDNIEQYFEQLVSQGIIPQEPTDYDAATLKIYIAHLEAENAELCARLENAVGLKATLKKGFSVFLYIVPTLFTGSQADK